MFLYNIHTPTKTYSIPFKDGESHSQLIDRIVAKASMNGDAASLKERKDGASLVYEFEGGRWALEDDGDLEILHSRLPPTSTPSATLHLTPPHARAHFASTPGPPAYSTASSAIKSKAQSPKKARPKTNGHSLSSSQDPGPAAGTESNRLGSPVPTKSSKSGSTNPSGPRVSDGDIGVPQAQKVTDVSAEIAKMEKSVGKTANGMTVTKPRSVLSRSSRRSKYGNDDAESLAEVNKRKWLEFHANNGVRTVVGKVGETENIRMLLKSGYRQVYVSRSFAIKSGLVGKTYAMGAAGYTGLKTLGSIPITVGGRTASHPALINEEQHFDVVLGRSWMEKMNVKVDPLDQTALTYMDSGEPIPCDLVVLKDNEGNVITIT